MEPRQRTLVDLLEERRRSDKVWLILPEDPERDDEATRLTFAEMVARAERVRVSLQASSVGAGRAVVLIYDNGPDFCAAFLGCILGGFIPVPLSPSYFVPLYSRFRERLRSVIAECDAPLVLAGEKEFSALEPADRAAFHVSTLASVSALAPHGLGAAREASASPSDIAFIQYTSGSTRESRGAELTHENVLYNVHGIGRAVRVSSDESALCWLPLYHDMGLSGLLLYTLYWGMSLVLMSPLQFITRPSAFLWAMSRFRCAGTAAPNFGYALCASSKRVREESLRGLDLSVWRAAICGGEAVQPGTIDAFVARFGPHGFRREAFLPSYGLAEQVVACTMTRAGGSGPRIEWVERANLERGAVSYATAPSERSRGIPSAGAPILGTEIRITGSNGEILPDRSVGGIEARGRSQMRGYHRNARATGEISKEDGWQRTGDLGYLSDGELYVVGREKELIKKAGAQYDAADMQAIVSRVPGVRAGCVAVFGVEDAGTGTESIVVLAEAPSVGPAEAASLAREIRLVLVRAFATSPDVVRLVSPGTLPKTSSGKVQTGEARRLFEDGALPAAED